MVSLGVQVKMLVRCLRSSFATHRFFCSSPDAESSILSTVAVDAAKLTNTGVYTQNTKNSSKPASRIFNSLSERLFRITSYNFRSIADVIAKWKEEGHPVSKFEIFPAIRGLMKHYRYADALQICDYMLQQKDFRLGAHDYASHIGLIHKVRGLQSAEQFFRGIPRRMMGQITSTALLRVFVKEGDTAKAEALMHFMRRSRFLSTHPYIHMMSLYLKNRQFDRAERMIGEFKSRIPPDVRLYNMWISACASRKNVGAAERAFAQMREANVDANWLTHATLAGLYIKKTMLEKAGDALREMEDVAPRSERVHCSLICHYGNMGNRDEALRIWRKLRSASTRMTDKEYGAMVWTLLKLDLLGKAEEVFGEWESLLERDRGSRNPWFSPSFRHASVLMKNYRLCGKMYISVGARAEEVGVESDLGLEEDDV